MNRVLKITEKSSGRYYFTDLKSKYDMDTVLPRSKFRQSYLENPENVVLEIVYETDKHWKMFKLLEHLVNENYRNPLCLHASKWVHPGQIRRERRELKKVKAAEQKAEAERLAKPVKKRTPKPLEKYWSDEYNCWITLAKGTSAPE